MLLLLDLLDDLMSRGCDVIHGGKLAIVFHLHALTMKWPCTLYVPIRKVNQRFYGVVIKKTMG